MDSPANCTEPGAENSASVLTESTNLPQQELSNLFADFSPENSGQTQLQDNTPVQQQPQGSLFRDYTLYAQRVTGGAAQNPQSVLQQSGSVFDSPPSDSPHALNTTAQHPQPIQQPHRQIPGYGRNGTPHYGASSQGRPISYLSPPTSKNMGAIYYSAYDQGRASVYLPAPTSMNQPAPQKYQQGARQQQHQQQDPHHSRMWQHIHHHQHPQYQPQHPPAVLCHPAPFPTHSTPMNTCMYCFVRHPINTTHNCSKRPLYPIEGPRPAALQPAIPDYFNRNRSGSVSSESCGDPEFPPHRPRARRPRITRWRHDENRGCGEGFVDYSVLHKGERGDGGRFEVVRCRVVRAGDAERGVYPVLQIPGWGEKRN